MGHIKLSTVFALVFWFSRGVAANFVFVLQFDNIWYFVQTSSDQVGPKKEVVCNGALNTLICNNNDYPLEWLSSSPYKFKWDFEI